ncbi:MAG: Branched-chain amino acid aminotransferase, partial [uncultured Nocardioidaceae bacterium]
ERTDPSTRGRGRPPAGPDHRRGAHEHPRGAGLRTAVHRPHAARRVDPRARLARRADHDVRPARARPGDRGAPLRAGDLRGAQGLPARRRVGVDLPARGERRPDGPLGPAARAAGAPRRGLRRDRRRARAGRRAVGAGRGGGEEPLPAAVHVRLRGVPRGAPVATRHLLRHRLARRVLLHQRSEAGLDPGRRALHACGGRGHRRGEDRRQLRQLAGAAAGGDRARLRPGRLPRRDRAPVRRGARRDEPLLRPGRRVDRHPGADRDHPRGDHPRLDHRARRQPRSQGRGAPGRHRRVARGHPQRPDHRGLRLRHRRGRDPARSARVVRRRGRLLGRRPGRAGHHRGPPGARRPAVRPGRGLLRLAAPGLL